MKKKVLVSLMIVLVFAILSPNVLAVSNSYSSDYRYWSQGASGYPRVKKYGCYIVALARMIVESGVDTSSSFNPDVFAKWEEDNGYIADLDTSIGQENMYAPEKYAETKGKKLKYICTKSYSDSTLWSYINSGYYCIVHIKYDGGSHHYVFVSNTDSINNGTLMFYESWSSATSVGVKNKSSLLGTYSGSYISEIYVYEGANSNSDTEPPTISNLSVSDVSGDSFTINCEVYDNVGVTRAYIIPYGPGGNSGNGFNISVDNSFRYTINTADYGGPGLYSVHVYVYDSAGNGTGSSLSDINAISDTESPVICNLYASNISSNSFTINCEVYDNKAVTRAYIIVYGPGGNSGNGFSISVFNNFSYTINTSDYGGRGTYSVHVYIFDDNGNSSAGALNDINAVTDSSAPVICEIRPTNVSNSSFTINCDVYDNKAVTRAYIIVYGPGGNSGNGFSIDVFNNFSHTINTSDYGGAGWYSVHIYIWDDDGNQSGGALNNFYVGDDYSAPQITELTVDNISDSAFTINCSTDEKVVRAWVNIYGPSGSNGYAISMYSTNFMHTIDTSKYGGAGSYEVHVYVWDAAGNESAGCSTGRFIANKRYTVNFNANLGITPLSSVIVTNSSTYGDLPIPTRAGYTFNGWYTSASGGDKITSDSIVRLTSAQTLYAQWEVADPCTKSTVTKTGTMFNITSTVYNIDETATVIVAGYKNGRFVTMDCVPYNQKEVSTTLTGDIDTIKVMVWSDLINQKPLCEEEIITSDENL